MQNLRLLPALLLGLLAAPASAQITITAADVVPAPGDTVRAQTATAEDPENAAAIVSATGANATYDFTVLTYGPPSTTVDVVALNTSEMPGTEFDVIADAEYVSSRVPGPGPHNYYSVGDEGAYYHGLVTFFDADFDGVDDQVVLYNTPPVLETLLPLDQHSAWESSAIQTSVADASTGGQVSVQQEYTKQAEVEGWGTLITPEGTAPALRLRSRIIITYEGEEFTTTLIEFLTKEGLYANVWLDDAGNPTTVTHTSNAVQRGDGGDGGGEENQPPAAAAITSPDDGASIFIGGAEGEDPVAPDTPFVVEWSAASDPEGDALTYTWQLATSSDFSSLLVDAPGAEGGTATRYETDFGTLAALLDDNGVELEDALTLYHRVVTSDGTNDVPGPPFSLVLTRGTFVSAEDDTGLPKTFALHGNYPNPFNPTTTFSFDLPAPAQVTLAVYDLVGREVATVVSARLPAGTFRYAWEAGHLPSGVYLYRLQAGVYTETRKLIVLK